MQKNTKSAKRNRFSPIPRCHYKIQRYNNNFLISYIYFPYATKGLCQAEPLHISKASANTLLRLTWQADSPLPKRFAHLPNKILFSTAQLISYISQVIFQDKTSASQNKAVSQW